jgi:ribosomal protein L16 Arg81 hydroxylase
MRDRETAQIGVEAALTGHTFKYAGSKYEPPYRNVKFIRGSFTPKSEKAGLKGAADLRRALKGGYTLQFYGVQQWQPTVASLAVQLTAQAVARPVNINLYITPPGTAVSLTPHSDFQCSLMVQLTGRKRWRLWKKPSIWLPVRGNQIRGRDEGDTLDERSLGRPYMDVELRPGDVLYVPRGCLHATSTPDGDLPSMHMTVGMETMWDVGEVAEG